MHLTFICHSINEGGAYENSVWIKNDLARKTIRVMTSILQLIARCHGAKKQTIFLAMKLTAIFLFVVCLTASADGLTQTITLSLKNIPVKKVFKEISKQTGISIVYSETSLDKLPPVTIQVKNATVQEVMDQCLSGLPFTYSIEGNLIEIKKKPTPTAVFQPPTAVGLAKVDPIDISGRVTDTDGNPLEGASIKVKGTHITTTTNSNGEFQLIGISENATLEISFVGYQTYTVEVNNKASITASLKIKPESLNEVMINKGYYTTSQKLNTGNVDKITAEEISKQPISNPLQALQGRTAGVYIQQSTGLPGGNFNVRIRGQNSIANGNNPLYVIDGVPYTSVAINSSLAGSVLNGTSPLNNFNPGDIESIEILKDADATAIYGSRGTNGVVLITTKRGKSGRTKVGVNFYQGWGKVSRKMDLLNTQQYLTMRREAFNNDGAAPGATDYDINGTWDTTRYTDWQKLLIGGAANVSNAQLSLSGGNANTQYLFGAGYYRETTVFPGDYADKKVNIHFNLNSISDNHKFNVNFTTNFVNDLNNLSFTDLTSQAISLAPNAPSVNDSMGKLNWPAGFQNPFAALLQKYRGNTDNFISNALLSYKITKGLVLKTSLGYTKIHVKENSAAPKVSFNPSSNPTSGTAFFSDNSFKSWIIEPQAEYQAKLLQGNFTVLIGTSFQQNLSNGTLLYGTGYSSDALLNNIAGASTVQRLSASEVLYRYNAVFGRVNYDWKEKYIVNLTGRRDGSSRFGPANRFANFGSVGLAWIVSSEKWFENLLSAISFLKIRVSYGTVGNDQIGDYQYLNTYSPTTYSYLNSPGLSITRLFNKDYGWETSKKLETAIDIGFLKDRINLSGAYYRSRSSNQLVGYPLPFTQGFGSIQSNLPATVENKSWEFALNASIIRRKNFSWTSNTNLTIPRNRLLEYPDILKSAYAFTYLIGQPLTIVNAFHYLGIDPSSGVYLFEDVNNNGVNFETADLRFLKKVAQDYYGGFQNNFRYKGFELDFLWQFVKQTGRNYLYYSTTVVPGSLGNQPIYVLDRWQKPGDVTTVQRFTQKAGTSPYLAFANGKSKGDITISDASFVRLKNISLSYYLPSALLKKIHVQDIKIYLESQNLFTITDYKGIDPENSGTGSLPPLRMLAAGIRLTF
jgi:TonB-linked SusC/RagA family outer membrane protein